MDETQKTIKDLIETLRNLTEGEFGVLIYLNEDPDLFEVMLVDDEGEPVYDIIPCKNIAHAVAGIKKWYLKMRDPEPYEYNVKERPDARS